MATMVQTLNERRERREREWWERVLAVIAEFGAQPRQPLLVPEDDPGNDATLLRLAGEVLFLRDQLQRIATAVEWTQAGKPFALIPPGPHADHSPREPTESRKQ